MSQYDEDRKAIEAAWHLGIMVGHLGPTSDAEIKRTAAWLASEGIGKR